ncbi:MAG: TolB family protein [Planctomycetota bacterium]
MIKRLLNTRLFLLALLSCTPVLVLTAGMPASVAAFKAFVVFRGDLLTVSKSELFAANEDGTQRVILSGTMDENADVTEFAWSPNRKYVAFVADRDTDNKNELYVVAAAGGEPLRVSGVVPDAQDVGAPLWSPDSKYIAYNVSGPGDDTLHIVEYDGAGDVVVGTTTGTINPGKYVWSLKGSMLGFLGSFTTLGRTEVYTCRSDGSDIIRLTEGIGGAFEVLAFKWAPNGKRLALRADFETNGKDELFIVNPDGSDMLKVSAPSIASGDLFEFEWAPNSSRILYTADAETDSVDELFIAHTNGTPAQKISPPPFNQNSTVESFVWSPNSQYAAYHYGQRDLAIPQPIFVTKFDGTGTVQLNVGSVGKELSDIAWTKDSKTVIYLNDFEVLFSEVLLSASRDGVNNNIISMPFVADGTAILSRLQSKKRRVGYIAEANARNLRELFAVGVDGSGHVMLSGALVSGGEVVDFQFSKTGTKIVYAADEVEDDIIQLFVVKTDGTGHLLLSGTPVVGSVAEFQVK